MNIREDVKINLKKAMMEKNVNLVSTLRLVIASIKEKDIIEKGKGNTKGLNNEEIISLLQTMIKQRKSSIELYVKGNRLDLAKKEENEIQIISNFLPKQLSNEEIDIIINNSIKVSNASSMKDVGKVIKLMKDQYNGKMNLGVVSQIIKKKLTNQ